MGKLWCAAGLTLAMLVPPAATVAAPVPVTTMTVTNAGDSGTGSLREAILAANNPAGLVRRIEFALPAMAGPIRPTSALPALTAPVTIDGYSQSGSAPASPGTPADLEVEIDASAVGTGLELDTDDSLVTGLAITGAGFDGLALVGSGNSVTGSYIGVSPSGAGVGNQQNGIRITGDDNTVGGTNIADRTIISDNRRDGVQVEGDRNRIVGNSIGLTPGAPQPLGNGGIGVEITGSANSITVNQITANSTGVVINAGTQDTAGTQNTLTGNAIGTDLGGDPGLGNFRNGVDVFGDQTALTANLIAGNVTGVNVTADDVSLHDNQIGVRFTPVQATPLPNISAGVFVSGSNATIGGAGHGNLIAANGGDGITLFSGTGHVVAANTIGTDSHGRPGLGNAQDGVDVRTASTMIGGPIEADANTIASNGFEGVRVSADCLPGATDCPRLQFNTIGTDGGAPLPNGLNGVRLTGDGTQVIENTVAFNGLAGIAVSGTNNPLISNRTFANTGLGVDLDPAGVTANDSGDVDLGANDLMNTPEVLTATAGSGVTAVDFRIRLGLPDTKFQVEFFSADACPAGPPPVRNASLFLGSALLRTGPAGNARDTVVLPVATTAGQIVTATATQVTGLGSLGLGSTSELAECRTVS